jgi:hypothetical protein
MGLRIEAGFKGLHSLTEIGKFAAQRFNGGLLADLLGSLGDSALLGHLPQMILRESETSGDRGQSGSRTLAVFAVLDLAEVRDGDSRLRRQLCLSDPQVTHSLVDGLRNCFPPVHCALLTRT